MTLETYFPADPLMNLRKEIKDTENTEINTPEHHT
jgi:hypothetical protein